MRGRVVLVAAAVAAASFACSGDDDDAETTSTSTTLAPVDVSATGDDYLEFATTEFVPGSPLSAIAHLERAQRDDAFEFDPASIDVADYAETFERIDTFVDTTDFDMLYLMNLRYGYGDALPAELRDAIDQRIVDFKYWYTEPTPEAIVDNKYYWSENHRIIFHTIEYLAGTALPETTFGNDGRTGAEHAADAEQRILEWLDEKVRFGFTEWHSDVYYQKDVTPLLTLAEFAPDEDIANRAAMVLDLVLLDIALHLQNGNFGATHGRSYMKDKSTALDQDTFGLAKLLFDDTSEPYQSVTDAGATLLSRAQKYEVPPVIQTIARSDEPLVDEEHMNVPLDPSAPVVADPEAPFGYDFEDPATVPFWWERGAQTAWQEVPMTIATLDQYELWDSEFFSPFKPLRDIVGTDTVAARNLAQSLAPILGFGLLSEVNTYTYRVPDVMLSTAQDYRPGVFGEQYHAWQATLDEHAIVFTTHPKEEPEQGTEWPDSDGYWTGTGTMPRSAQHETAAIHIYTPGYTPSGPPLDAFGYVDYTHAYFPQEHFDEVVQNNGWTFGRKGDGYVGLWSARPTTWREPGPGVFTHGLTEPFDLVAEGGADNVWIVEVGDASRWDSFETFQSALSSTQVEVTAREPSADGLPGGFDVSYVSPIAGTMTFGSDGALAIDGEEVNIHPEPRMHNPFVDVPFDGRTYEIAAAGQFLTLDFDAWTRAIN